MKIIKQNLAIKSASNDTIARADDIFTGYIDSDFENYGTDVKSPKTDDSKVAVLEMDTDGTFKEIFGSISLDLDSLCLTQAQIIEFVKVHKSELRQGGYSTFFLFKVKSEFFVASVSFVVVNLRVGVSRLSNKCVWNAMYSRRVVVPQLALGNMEVDTLPAELIINGVSYKRQ